MLRGLFVLSVAVALLAGSAAAAFAHEGEHDGHASDAADLTAEEQAVVDDLIAAAQETAARYADIDDAAAAGYLVVAFKPVGGTDLRQTHAMNPTNVRDGRDLDPSAPEGLMYVRFPDGETVLVALVFTAPVGEGPTPAGDAFAWHTHYTCRVDGAPQALPAGAETCPDGSPARPPRREMLHLWTVDHPGGPFAEALTIPVVRALIEAHA